MADDVAIKVEDVSKAFRIPHEKHTSLKSAALNVFKKKDYTEFNAASGITFEVKKGEFVGIIGRNGSGKSTLLKMLAGIYIPDQGKITISGRLSPFLELGVGFNPELTARENVYLGGSILGLTKKEIDDKFDDIIRFAELEEFVDMKFKNFSSGMQVRLAFSLSIHAHAEILLMDEVLAVGDSNFQNKCMDQFLKYKREGKTVVLVSHNIDAVREYCDCAILIHEGKIYSSGDVNKITADYVNLNIDNSSKSEDKEKTNRGWIKRIRLLVDGRVAKTVKTGQTIKVAITYDIKETINNPIFGYIIRDQMGRKVFGTNTVMKKIKTGKVDKGKYIVTSTFDNLFASGVYTLSPAIAYENKKNIEWIEDMVKFRVVNPEFNSGGVVDLAHDIRLGG